MTNQDDSNSGRVLDTTDVLPPTTRLVGGKYRLGRMLGEGGMGAVYEAEHTGLGIKVAVKLLNEIFASDPSALTRFRREARAAAAIRHDNVVAVTDTGTDDDGVPFIVMELLEGESLSAVLRRERVLQPKDAASVAHQLLHGLEAAHSKGVIHRDLKPGNVLINRGPDGAMQVKILDFGISKFWADTAFNVTETGAVVGTPRFMSPEQARGQSDLDARVDIYAVGVLLYRMLTGRLPFTGRSQEEIIAETIAGDHKRPREIRKDIPESLERVILKAMATDRRDRYPTALSIIKDLRTGFPELPTTTYLTVPARPATGESETGTAPSGIGSETRPASPDALRHHARVARRGLLRNLAVAAMLVGIGAAAYVYATRAPPPSGNGGQLDNRVTATAGQPLRFGISRYLPEDQLRREYAPLVGYLSKQVRRPILLEVAEDYVDLAKRMQREKLDFAALSSCDYVRAKRRYPGLTLMATHVTTGGATYEGYIVARADSPVQKLQDLKGRVFCYTHVRSCSGYVYPRAIFRQHGMDPDRDFKTSRITGDHVRALVTLHEKGCDGAAVFAGLLFESKDHGLAPQQFRILATTERIPYDAYTVRDTLDEKTQRALKTALLALKPNTQLAKSTLGEESRIVGFTQVDDTAYDRVRAIEKHLDDSQ